MKNENKVKTLHCVNDAEASFVVTDKIFAISGNHEVLVAALAAAIVTDEDICGIVSDAISLLIKNSHKPLEDE